MRAFDPCRAIGASAGGTGGLRLRSVGGSGRNRRHRHFGSGAELLKKEPVQKEMDEAEADGGDVGVVDVVGVVSSTGCSSTDKDGIE